MRQGIGWRNSRQTAAKAKSRNIIEVSFENKYTRYAKPLSHHDFDHWKDRQHLSHTIHPGVRCTDQDKSNPWHLSLRAAIPVAALFPVLRPGTLGPAVHDSTIGAAPGGCLETDIVVNIRDQSRIGDTDRKRTGSQGALRQVTFDRLMPVIISAKNYYGCSMR